MPDMWPEPGRNQDFRFGLGLIVLVEFYLLISASNCIILLIILYSTFRNKYLRYESTRLISCISLLHLLDCIASLR